MEKRIDQPVPAQPGVWKERLGRVRAGVKKSLPFVAGIAATLAALLLYNLLFPPPRPLNSSDVNTIVAHALASATPAPALSEQVYQEIQPSLVLVQAKIPGSDGKEEDSLGSGVIINTNGDILTSLHVVARASSVKVTFADGSQSSAQVATQQPQDDIAVLRANQPPAQIIPATIGNPNSVRIGDEAYVVGNPFGLYGSMSAGVISGLDRSFQPTNSNLTLQGLIQIDAAVNPGNSGGPLLDRYGQVIGIVEGIVNPTGQDVFIGIAFAVPIDVAGGAAGLPPD